jgi:hypothetical protein
MAEPAEKGLDEGFVAEKALPLRVPDHEHRFRPMLNTVSDGL